MRRQIIHEQNVKNGRKGGKKTAERHGDKYSEWAKKGGGRPRSNTNNKSVNLKFKKSKAKEPRNLIWQTVCRAVKRGEIMKKKNCEKCGLEKKLQGHHPDYNKPLDVVFLCHKCHEIEHKKLSNVADLQKTSG